MRHQGPAIVSIVARSAGFAGRLVALCLLCAAPVGAIDPPHSLVNFGDCMNCHMIHHALGNPQLNAAGNANVCLSCHNPTGPAAARSFDDVDQSLPGVTGTSHRWDSSSSGHAEPATSNTSTGSIRTGGAFTGRIEKSYTITIDAGGDVGFATFSWADSEGNPGWGTSGTNVDLADGLNLTFLAGAATPDFAAGDSWTLFVRTDLRQPDEGVPFEAPLAARVRVAKGKVVCSACHDQHSQVKEPFRFAGDAVPGYSGDGSGWIATGIGRHYRRQTNTFNDMCVICHSARNVTSSAQGSHPVGISIPFGDFQNPASLPLDTSSPDNQIRCMTCHALHYADSGGANGGAGNGYILRIALSELCTECHTLADQNNGSHFDSGTGALWPGGQYGSSFPAHGAERRGFCVNCHWPHGWPDATTTPDNFANDYPRLWVELYDVADDGSDADEAESLCYTCHDSGPVGTGASTDLRTELLKGTNGAEIFHHPVADSEQSAGRSVECVDCHNPHTARPDNKLAGVTGVDIAGLDVGPGTGNERDPVQYELCFKCHGDTFNAARPDTSNKRLDFQTGNSAFHPVVGAGQNQSANLANALLGGLTTSSAVECTDCHNSDSTADALGSARNSTHVPQGPHGSNHAAIRRAFYWTDLQGPADWNRDNFELCLLCHDPARLVEAEKDDDNPPASTNFYDDIDGRDNLHWVHLEDRADKSRATCKNCHFNIHSNRTANNTQYRIDGVVFDSPPPNVKTHLVDFSPDVQALDFAKPEWRINTSNRRRQCNLSCHGADMESFPYRPGSGDDVPTIP